MRKEDKERVETTKQQRETSKTSYTVLNKYQIL
jgi:hypothetical protein